MKVTIIEGPHTDENLQRCYKYILEIYRREKVKDATEAGKTIEKCLEANKKV